MFYSRSVELFSLLKGMINLAGYCIAKRKSMNALNLMTNSKVKFFPLLKFFALRSYFRELIFGRANRETLFDI